MVLSLVCADRSPVPLALSEADVLELATFVLAAEGVERPCELSVSVVGDDEMARLNGELRGVDGPTDVLSVELERPGDADLAPGEPCCLGDVVLDPAHIRDQARRLGTTEADETRLLIVHGMLHLLGYDHVREEDALIMEAREDELVAEATRGALPHVATTRHGGEGSARGTRDPKVQGTLGPDPAGAPAPIAEPPSVREGAER